MLYGRRLDDALEHVGGSRYALAHAVAKRARQITLWLTADPTELRAESAPPPSASEFVSRDPVALAETEIINGEVFVRWDPEGRADERDLPAEALLPAEPLLLDGLDDDDEFDTDADDPAEVVTPALAQVLEVDDTIDDEIDDTADDDDEVPIVALVDDDEADADADADGDEIIEVPLEPEDDGDDEDED